jgi:rod shape-determining protein MreC
VVVLISILLFVVMGITTAKDSRLGWVSNILSVPLTPVQSLFSAAGERISHGFSFFRDINAVKQQNEQLKSKVDALEKENRELAAYRDKIRELQNALSLKEQFSEYKFTGANVIGKDPGNWFHIFKIDVGTKEGMKSDFTVVTAGKGLVGRIQKVEITSSKVLSIIDEDSTVSGWISKPTGGHVIIKGDLKLKEKGLCRMDYIPVDVDVEIDDVIETSGLGGIYPKGIVIGKVVDIKKTTSELNRFAIIEPVVNFKNLEEVFVLKSKSDNIGSVEP